MIRIEIWKQESLKPWFLLIIENYDLQVCHLLQVDRFHLEDRVVPGIEITKGFLEISERVQYNVSVYIFK